MPKSKQTQQNILSASNNKTQDVGLYNPDPLLFLIGWTFIPCYHIWSTNNTWQKHLGHSPLLTQPIILTLSGLSTIVSLDSSKQTNPSMLSCTDQINKQWAASFS